MQVYYEALSDLPIEAVESAATHLQRHGGEFFPSSATWHKQAELERDQYLRDHLEHREEPWHYECDLCMDTGFEYHRGPRKHAPKPEWRTMGDPEQIIEWTCKCACRATNKTYQREIERRRAYRRQG
jgi:cation transport regulator ChaB